ncbi:SBBP repeat-containing protein [Dolichospermum planctonicum CS-1226]|uniref:SBBP repeat-containing protein n=1 Tax=Dolichospermum planctonicum CS-1226 TaxID=3021751 RepID=A0ABT5AIK5_9CYAN|nr:SBBP repeat-containing protein [Dolichospermum planctonicum]MDB9537124.1 SBBP repeat-containing protein [Dolichospermum planctonicum CS-1226]
MPQVIWTKLLGGTGDDVAFSITTGSDGAIYVAGDTSNNLDGETNSGGQDAFVTKYNTDGTKAWTQLLGNTGNDNARSITTGSDGAIYVAGGTYGNLNGQTNSGDQDAFVTRYNTDGTKAWTQLLPGTSIDQANSLTTGSDGAIYVAGYTYGGSLDGQTYNSGIKAFVTKYNTNGTKAWTKLLPGTGYDYASSITTGSDGAIYVAGYTYGGSLDGQTYNGGGNDAFVAKYNTDGTKAWIKVIGTSGTDVARSITTDSNGAIYVAGGTDGNLDGQMNSGGGDAFVTKYNTNGTKAWTRLLGGSGFDIARSITTGSDGAIYVAGYTSSNLDGQTNSGGEDAFVTKYNTDGTKAWTKLLGTGSSDNAFSITTGSDGAIYVAGYTYGGSLDGQTNSGRNDAFVIKLKVNDAPVITSAATATFAENGTGTVYTVTATDADANTTLTYSLSGTDANLFDINNGIVTFKTAPNFELPGDSGANNVYDINVIASDGILNTTKAVAITVTNVNDDFQSALSYTLNSSQIDLTLTGSGNINGTGNSLNNTIFGNSGNNLLDGRAGADSLVGNAGNDTLMGGLGADTMTGGTGNDWYWVDNAGDIVIELANEGTDKVFTTISYTLTDNVEDLALQETAANINGTGNGLNNTITDNTKDNVLDGGAGNDIIRASGGNDTLTGGLGTDTLTGGLGNDSFVYTDLTHSLLAGIDSIKDFNNSTETDRFVVSTARSVFNTVGVVTGLNATAIGNALTITNFGANAAALFTIGSKRYVAINDSTAGFNASTDAIVEITGYKGTLSTDSFVIA